MSIPLPKLPFPASRLVIEQSHLNHPQSKLQRVLKDHPFNYMLETIIPNSSDEEPNINDIENRKYYEARIQVSSLIHKAFIEAFVKRGKLQLISCQNRLDDDDVVSLSPSGILCLHLTKQSYQQLGIDGKPSSYNCRKTHQTKYVVEIDLTKPYFQPTRKMYENTRVCFAERHTQFYDVVFTWKPEDDSIAPISVSRYFQSIGYKCKEMNLEIVPHIMKSISRCPVIDPHNMTNDGGEVDHVQLWEWLGAVSCDVPVCSQDQVCEEDSFITTYTCPEPSQKIDGIFRETATGLIAISDIEKRLECLRELSAKHGWCVLTVHGYADAPVTWGSKEHGYLLDGDNIYSILLFADGTYWLFYALGSSDCCP